MNKKRFFSRAIFSYVLIFVLFFTASPFLSSSNDICQKLMEVYNNIEMINLTPSLVPTPNNTYSFILQVSWPRYYFGALGNAEVEVNGNWYRMIETKRTYFPVRKSVWRYDFYAGPCTQKLLLSIRYRIKFIKRCPGLEVKYLPDQGSFQFSIERKVISINILGVGSYCPGDKALLQADVLDEQGCKMVGVPLFWESLDSSVASVDEGLINAVGAGQTIITAETIDHQISGNIQITVNTNIPEDMLIVGPTTITQNTEVTYYAYVISNAGCPSPIDICKIIWDISPGGTYHVTVIDGDKNDGCPTIYRGNCIIIKVGTASYGQTIGAHLEGSSLKTEVLTLDVKSK